MYTEILALVRTVEDQYLLEEEIRHLTAAIFDKKGNNLEITLTSKVRARFAALFRQGMSAETTPEVYLQGLATSLEKMRPLKLTLAFEPTDSFIDRLHFFAIRNIGTDIVLDITTDPTIGGGAVISFLGEYRDFSLVRFMEMEFEKKQAEIMKLMDEKMKVPAMEPQ